jgi:hypothetical protein
MCTLLLPPGGNTIAVKYVISLNNCNDIFVWVLMGKPEGTRPLGRFRRRWKDNIKRDLQEVGGGFGDWMERALVSTVMNFRVP